MPRDVEKLITETVAYVVDIDNNREDPDPFYVDILPMTAGESMKHDREMGDFTGAKVNFTERAQKQIAKIFADKVTGCHRYSIRHHKTGDKIEPRNGAALYRAIMDHGDEKEAKIIDDIVKAVKDNSHLKAGLLETLRSQSAQQFSETTSEAGAASDADARTPSRASFAPTKINGARETATKNPTPTSDSLGNQT